jgi:hypothetical protein
VTDRDLNAINDALDALRGDLATLAQGVEEIGDVVQALARSADRGGAGLASKSASGVFRASGVRAENMTLASRRAQQSP